MAGVDSQIAQIGPSWRGSVPGSSIGIHLSAGTHWRIAASSDSTERHLAGMMLMPDAAGPMRVRRPSLHHRATATSGHLIPITVRLGCISDMPSAEKSMTSECPDPGIGSTRTPLIRAPELAGTGVKPSTVIGISLGSEREEVG